MSEFAGDDSGIHPVVVTIVFIATGYLYATVISVYLQTPTAGKERLKSYRLGVLLVTSLFALLTLCIALDVLHVTPDSFRYFIHTLIFLWISGIVALSYPFLTNAIRFSYDTKKFSRSDIKPVNQTEQEMIEKRISNINNLWFFSIGFYELASLILYIWALAEKDLCLIRVIFLGGYIVALLGAIVAMFCFVDVTRQLFPGVYTRLATCHYCRKYYRKIRPNGNENGSNGPANGMASKTDEMDGYEDGRGVMDHQRLSNVPTNSGTPVTNSGKKRESANFNNQLPVQAERAAVLQKKRKKRLKAGKRSLFVMLAIVIIFGGMSVGNVVILSLLGFTYCDQASLIESDILDNSLEYFLTSFGWILIHIGLILWLYTPDVTLNVYKSLRNGPNDPFILCGQTWPAKCRLPPTQKGLEVIQSKKKLYELAQKNNAIGSDGNKIKLPDDSNPAGGIPPNQLDEIDEKGDGKEENDLEDGVIEKKGTDLGVNDEEQSRNDRDRRKQLAQERKRKKEREERIAQFQAENPDNPFKEDMRRGESRQPFEDDIAMLGRKGNILRGLSKAEDVPIQIKLIIFEFDGVLTNDPQNPFSTWRVEFFETAEDHVYLGFFDGEARIKMLQDEFSQLISHDIILCLYARLESVKIETILKRINLMSPFFTTDLASEYLEIGQRRMTETNSDMHGIQKRKKWIESIKSNRILGIGHPNWQERQTDFICDAINHMELKHEEILYVGRDKQMTEFFNESRLCRTYLCGKIPEKKNHRKRSSQRHLSQHHQGRGRLGGIHLLKDDLIRIRRKCVEPWSKSKGKNGKKNGKRESEIQTIPEQKME